MKLFADHFYQRVVQCGFLFALTFSLLASSSSAQPTMSRGEKLLPISYSECIQRAERAYRAEGWVNIGGGGAFVSAFKENNGAYITCNVAPENKVWVNIFVASNSGDSNVPGGERVKLERQMENSASSGDCVIPTISGVYTTTGDPVGVMRIDRSGAFIVATYGNDENSLVNKLEGNFKCNVLSGTFTNTIYNSTGAFSYTFSQDGSSFTGYWLSGGRRGEVNGRKK